MGGSESTRRRASTSSADADAWIPTLKYRKVIEGPNAQQHEEITWLFQIWRDDSFMFRQQTTVKVRKDFRNPRSEPHKEIVLQITYFGSGGRVVLTDFSGFPLASASKIGSAFAHLYALHKADAERKHAKSRGDGSALEALRPFHLLLRTQRVEFMKRHQRPAHISDNNATGRKRTQSIVVPDAHGLVNTAILIDPAMFAKMSLDSDSAPPSIRVPKKKPRPGLEALHINPYAPQPSTTQPRSNPKNDFKEDDLTAPAILTEELDQPFDWEWECDGIIEEGPSFITQLQTFFPPRIIDAIVSYAEPSQHKIESALPSPTLNFLIPQRSRGATHTAAVALTEPSSPVSVHGLTPLSGPPVPPSQRSTSVFATIRKKSPTEADFIASVGCLRIFVEVSPRTDAVKLSYHSLNIKPPAVADAKGTRIDPDVDVNINFIKEPSPEPIALPQFEVEPIQQLVLEKIPEKEK